MIDYYVGRKSELEGGAIERDQFDEIYRLSAIQRDLKVVGRFYYLDLVKGKPGYKKFIPPTVRRLRKNLPLTAQTKDASAAARRDISRRCCEGHGIRGGPGHASAADHGRQT